MERVWGIIKSLVLVERDWSEGEEGEEVDIVWNACPLKTVPISVFPQNATFSSIAASGTLLVFQEQKNDAIGQ